jgi:hypothetical protein
MRSFASARPDGLFLMPRDERETQSVPAGVTLVESLRIQLRLCCKVVRHAELPPVGLGWKTGQFDAADQFVTGERHHQTVDRPLYQLIRPRVPSNNRTSVARNGSFVLEVVDAVIGQRLDGKFMVRIRR